MITSPRKNKSDFQRRARNLMKREVSINLRIVTTTLQQKSKKIKLEKPESTIKKNMEMAILQLHKLPKKKHQSYQLQISKDFKLRINNHQLRQIDVVLNFIIRCNNKLKILERNINYKNRNSKQNYILPELRELVVVLLTDIHFDL